MTKNFITDPAEYAEAVQNGRIWQVSMIDHWGEVWLPYPVTADSEDEARAEADRRYSGGTERWTVKRVTRQPRKSN